jgi:hypothetical protein
MTVSSDTANSLDQLAAEIEMLPGASGTVDAQMRALIVEPAQVIFGQTLLPLAPYTANLITALNRLRPKGYKFACQEIWQPPPAPTHVAGFEKKGDQPGFTVGGSSGWGQGPTLTIAGCAALARLWASIIREYLGG